MITWVETTEERYYEMLGVLPPASQCGGAFLVGEPMSMRNGAFTFSAFKKENGKFYASDEAVTFKEFKAEMANAVYRYTN